MPALSRSALLVCWAPLALAAGPAGGVSAADRRAVRLVTGDDDPHTFQLEPAARAVVDSAGLATAPQGRGGPPAGRSTRPGLAELLAALRALGVRGLRLAHPVPGDVLGLPGPAAFNAVALEAGEAVLTLEPGPALGLVPQVTRFGSTHEPGAMVSWSVHAVAPRPAALGQDLAGAEQELREALRQATQQLADLDVARWRPDVAHRLASVREAALLPGLLPPGAPARAVRVLDLAIRLQAVTALAVEDDGAAITGGEALQRSATLRALASASRRAVVAAVDAVGRPPQ